MTRYQTQSARASIDALAGAGLGQVDYFFAALELVRRAVPYDAMCIGSIDPATHILTDSAKVGLVDSGDPEFLFHEYAVADVNQFADMAHSDIAVGVLSESTGGDPMRSARYRNVVKPLLGVEHELRGVARVGGLMWGAYAIYRESGSPAFNQAEAEFMAQLEHSIALGMRASIIATVAQNGLRAQAGPAVLVFDSSGRLQQATAAADERVRDLGGELWGLQAVAVSTIVAAARGVASNRTVSARLRARGASGQWFTLHAAPFTAGADVTSIAVTIEPASPPEILPLIVSAHGLTDREGEVVMQMLRGESTHAIAQTLHLSPYTVQDHFKTIFDKVGVSSRRELATRIFYGQYVDRYGEKLPAEGGFARPAAETPTTVPGIG